MRTAKIGPDLRLCTLSTSWSWNGNNRSTTVVVIMLSDAFVRNRLITNGVYSWVTHLHIAVPTITRYFTLRVIHELKRRNSSEEIHPSDSASNLSALKLITFIAWIRLFLSTLIFYFFYHTKIPVSSKAEEGKTQLGQQEEVPIEVKENQVQKNRK